MRCATLGRRSVHSGFPSPSTGLFASMRVRTGRRYASVLPLPVSAPRTTSLPSMMEDAHAAWILVGCENPSFFTAPTSLSSSPISSNPTLLSNIPPASPLPADVIVRPHPFPPLPDARAHVASGGLLPPPPTNPDISRQKAGGGRQEAATASAGPVRPRIDDPHAALAREIILIRGAGGPEKPRTALLVPCTSIIEEPECARADTVQQANVITMAAAVFMEAALDARAGPVQRAFALWYRYCLRSSRKIQDAHPAEIGVRKLVKI